MAKREILVPLDGSVFGEVALPAAITIAQRLAADIALLAVTPQPGESAIQSIIEAFSPATAPDTWSEEYLRARAQDVGEVSGCAVAYHLRSGAPADMILDFARERRSTAIVMTTHGRGPLTRTWLGSVADRVLREAVAPIVLVRPHDDHLRRRPELTSHLRFRRIVVPMDGSGQAEEALPWAIRLGDDDTAYALLQALALPTPQPLGPTGTTADRLPGLLNAARAEAEAYLTQVAEPYRKRHHDVKADVTVDGSPTESILRYAEEFGADLIALGIHGRGGLLRAVIGGVADKVVRGASCPVLVVPPKEAVPTR